MTQHGTGQRLIRMELKYCERCGGILLRRAGDPVVYCGPCELSMRELPSAKINGDADRQSRMLAERTEADCSTSNAGVMPESEAGRGTITSAHGSQELEQNEVPRYLPGRVNNPTSVLEQGRLA